MENQLKQYKRITSRRNAINIKRQIVWTAVLFLIAILAANFITYSLIHFIYDKA